MVLSGAKEWKLFSVHIHAGICTSNLQNSVSDVAEPRGNSKGREIDLRTIAGFKTIISSKEQEVEDLKG